MDKLLGEFTIDYSREDGEILFHSPNGWDSIIAEIYGIIATANTFTDVYTTKEGGLSISIPVFIEYYWPILEILRHITLATKTTDSAREIFQIVREIVQTEDILRPELSKEELQSRLDSAGWNSEKRPLSDFQMRNLIQTSRRDNAAIFSVPGAGKTVEALAFSSVVSGPDTLFVIVCPRNAYISWEKN